MTIETDAGQARKMPRKPSKAAKEVRLVRVPRSSRVSASYLALAAAYPIHPIRSEEDLNEALQVLYKLLCRRKPLDPQEQDYRDSLGHEIERYEAAAYPMPAVSDAALLKHLIEARDATLSEVADAVGIAVSTLSSVLTGKRKLNRSHIGKLAPYFGVEPGVFLG